MYSFFSRLKCYIYTTSCFFFFYYSLYYYFHRAEVFADTSPFFYFSFFTRSSRAQLNSYSCSYFFFSIFRFAFLLFFFSCVIFLHSLLMNFFFLYEPNGIDDRVLEVCVNFFLIADEINKVKSHGTSRYQTIGFFDFLNNIKCVCECI